MEQNHQQHAQVLCDDCDSWVPVEGESETVSSDCGERVVVTVTWIPTRLV
jgi:hypothetical protein